MTKRAFERYAAAAGLAAALSLAAVTPSSAQWRGGHWGAGAAIGAGIAGFALGAAAATAPYYGAPYGYGYGDYYDYAPGYAPGAVVVVPAPTYYGDYYAYDPYWGRRPGRCRFDIRGC
jgi:hypothetical protein